MKPTFAGSRNSSRLGPSVVILSSPGFHLKKRTFGTDIRKKRMPLTAEGILLATERYDKSDPVNLGAGFEIRISELTRMIAEIVGFNGEIVWDTDKPDGQPRRSLDTIRAERDFGFKAGTPLEAGLRRTIEWYLDNDGTPDNSNTHIREDER
jgi:dTDP-D-glucose 4,6-dehydratase